MFRGEVKAESGTNRRSWVSRNGNQHQPPTNIGENSQRGAARAKHELPGELQVRQPRQAAGVDQRIAGHAAAVNSQLAQGAREWGQRLTSCAG